MLFLLIGRRQKIRSIRQR